MQSDRPAFLNVDGLPIRQQSVLRRLYDFYSAEMLSSILIPLIDQEGVISLRALDWLVTNYAKKNNIVCTTRRGDLFNIFHGYKVALAHWRRRNFDPFRRRQRIAVCVNGVQHETTVGQLNFLHWAHLNGVLQYAQDNAEHIEHDMNQASHAHKVERKQLREAGHVHRRRELSSAPCTKCHVYSINTKVTFGSDCEDDDAEM
jgi:hypothetical protein